MTLDFVTPGYYYWFLPVTMILYFTFLKGRRDQRVILLVAMSYLFFWLASGWHFILLAISTCTDWVAGRRISDSDVDSTRKRWLMGSLTINLGLLATFKYLDFFIETLNLVTLRLPSSPEIGTAGLLLPVGISFYTFQTMSYTIDIYRGKSNPYERFQDFACYASFFPQLVAGPIVRSHEFIKQIESPREFSFSRSRLGLTLIVYGLFKKMVIADNVALHANSIFIEGAALDNSALVWWGLYASGYRFIVTSLATPTLLLVQPTYWESNCQRTFEHPMQRPPPGTSGGGGTSLSQLGSETTCISPWGGAGTGRGQWRLH